MPSRELFDKRDKAFGFISSIFKVGDGGFGEL